MKINWLSFLQVVPLPHGSPPPGVGWLEVKGKGSPRPQYPAMAGNWHTPYIPATPVLASNPRSWKVLKKVALAD